MNLLIGKSGGVVRIINRKTAERALLKDLTGKVVDIAFAYTDDVILAAVDEVGNLLVHSVREGDDKKIQYPYNYIEICVHVIHSNQYVVIVYYWTEVHTSLLHNWLSIEI